MKATEKSRMQAEMMDRVSCAQKLNQPMRRQASDAFARAFRATSETAGLVFRGSSSAEVFALVTVACSHLIITLMWRQCIHASSLASVRRTCVIAQVRVHFTCRVLMLRPLCFGAGA